MNLVNKLGVKTIVGGKITKPAEADAPRTVARIFGIAKGTVTGATDFGDFVGFKGDFKGINLETGEEFRSAKCFLPDIATGILLSALENTGEGESKDVKGTLKRKETSYKGSVEFGFDISVKHADNAVGYEYMASPLMPVADSDPLALMQKNIPALPAPKKVEHVQVAHPITHTAKLEPAHVASKKK